MRLLRLGVLLLLATQLQCKEEDHLNDPLFSGEDAPEGWRLAVTSFLCWVVTSFAVAAGIGGGGLLVPLYALVLGLGTKLAIPVSKATIFGVACGNVLFISRERHPKAERPLIDYSTVGLMQPGELLGVVFGVLLNRLLPEISIVIILVFVLGFNAYKTLTKARARWKAETKAMREAGSATRTVVQVAPAADAKPAFAESTFAAAGFDAADGPPDEEDGPVKCEAGGDADCCGGPAAVPKASSERLAEVLALESQQFPLWAWASLLAMTAFLVVYSFVMSGTLVGTFEDAGCASAYWPVYLTPVFAYGAIMLLMGMRNIRAYEEKVDLGFAFADGDLVWTTGSVGRLIPAAVAAGVAAGLLGIGGGMILGPLFVSLNFQPQVGTASTGFMILFTALAGTVQYLAVGKLSWRMFVWFGIIGAIGGQTGQRVVKKLILKTGRPSLVVFILGIIIALAVVIMASSGIANAVSNANDGEDIWAIDGDPFVCDDASPRPPLPPSLSPPPP